MPSPSGNNSRLRARTSVESGAIDPDPLSSASLRYSIRPVPGASLPSAPDTRPFGLRDARPIPRPQVSHYRYSQRLQMAVTDDGDERPLLLVLGEKDWKTKTKSDGDEGEEEDFGWEES